MQSIQFVATTPQELQNQINDGVKTLCSYSAKGVFNKGGSIKNVECRY